MSDPNARPKPANPVRVANIATPLDLASWARTIGEHARATDLELYAECISRIDEAVA